MVVDIFNTEKKYDLILADPPWKQSKGGKKSTRPNSSGGRLDYPVCDLEEIEIHIRRAAENTDGNAVLFLREKTLELMGIVVGLMAQGELRTITIEVTPTTKAKISCSSKGKINVERIDTRKCKLEE